jgi:hypothetical protein
VEKDLELDTDYGFGAVLAVVAVGRQGQGPAGRPLYWSRKGPGKPEAEKGPPVLRDSYLPLCTVRHSSPQSAGSGPK